MRELVQELRDALSELSVGDVFDLKGDELRSLVSKDSPKRDFILRVATMDWVAADLVPARARKIMRDLLPLTLPGKELDDKHPGHVVVYRGGLIKKGEPQSFSLSQKQAKGFGSLLTKITVTPATPALDLDKVLGKGQSEAEVVLSVR